MIKKIFLSLIILLILSISVSAQTFYAPLFNETTNLGEDFSGTIIVNNATNPQVELLSHDGTIKSFNIDSSGYFVIPGEIFFLQKEYKIRFRDGPNYFPENGWFKTYVNREKTNYFEHYKNFLLNDTASSLYCQTFNENYNCRLEHFQAYEIKRFAKLYSQTNNENYKEIMNQLINTSWSGGLTGSRFCDPQKADFNCGETEDLFAGKTYHGAQRQGIIIRELWKAYLYTKDETILELAINFSQGTPQECDVHQGDYNCGSNKSQGLMIQGYAEAYKNTANTTYFNILQNLITASDPQDPSVELIKGYLLAKPFIQGLEQDIVDMMREIIGSCSDCEENEIVSRQLLFLEAIKHDIFDDEILGNESLKYLINRELYDLFSSSGLECDHNQENYRCDNPEIQVLKSDLHEHLTYNVFSVNNTFFDVRILSVDQGGNTTIRIKYKGELTNPKIHLRNFLNIADPFDEYSLDKKGIFEINESVIISGDNFHELGSSFIQIYFSDGDTRYPHNNYFVLPIVLEASSNDIYKDIILANPIKYCNPFSENPEYSCRYEYMQGIYLGGISETLNFKNNETIINKIKSLYNVIIDASGFFSTCDPNINDYQCETEADPYVPFIKPGVFRAASLAIGYMEAYKQTGETRLLRDAEILLNKEWEDCGPVKNRFDCGEVNQGKIIQAMTLLYELTGDHLYKEWLEELILEKKKNDVTDVLGLIKAHPHTQNENINETMMLEAFSENIEQCINPGTCSPRKFYESLKATWEAYKYFNNEYYFDVGSDLLRSRPTGSLYCMPLEETFEENKFCQYPHEQGFMISALKSVKDNFVIFEAPELNLSLESPEKGDLGSLISVNCTVQNMDDTQTLFRAVVGLATNQKLVSPNSSNVEVTNLGPGETRTANYILNLTEGGRSNLRCQILNYEASQQLNVTNIGEIFSISHNPIVNVFLNNTLTINITNMHSFNLENVEFNITNMPESANGSEDNVFNKHIMQSFESIILEYYFEEMPNKDFNITINATSDFEGKTNKTLFFRTITNELNINKEFSHTIPLFKETNVYINISHDKPFNLTNLSLSLKENESITINSIVGNADDFTLSNNSYELITISLTNIVPGNNTLSFNVFGEQGINISKNITFKVIPEILSIQAQDVTTPLNETFYLSLITQNTGDINQTNISLTFYNSSNFTLDNLSVLDFYLEQEMHNFSNTSLQVNKTEFFNNISLLENNYSINWSGYYDFNITAFNENEIISSKITINYELNGSNGVLNFFQNNESLEDVCLLKSNLTQTICEINISKGEIDLLFSFNETGNLSLQFLNIKNNVSIPRNRTNISEGLVIFDYIEENESVELVLEGRILEDKQYLFVEALSSELGYAFINVSVNKKIEEKEESSRPRDEPGSSVGGGAFVEVPPDIENDTIILWEYYRFSSIEKFTLANTELLKYFHDINISNLNYTSSLNKSRCLSANRQFDLNTSEMFLNITNNCDVSLSELFVFELIEKNNFLQKDEFLYESFSEGTLMHIGNLGSKEEVIIKYELFNFSKEKFQEIFVHIQEKDELFEEELVEEIEEEKVERAPLIVVDFDTFFDVSIIVLAISATLALIYFFIRYFISNKYKYILATRKSYKRFKPKGNNKHKSIKLSEDDVLLASMNLKLKYVDKLIHEENIEEAKKALSSLISEYNRNTSFFIKKHPKKIKNKVDFIEVKFLELKEKLSNNDVAPSQVNAVENIAQDKQSNAVPKQEEDEQESTEEIDVFVKILKIDHLIDEEKLDEAKEELDRVKQKIDNLDDIEKKFEKAFLLDKIEPYEGTIQDKMNSSRKYKVRKFINEKKEFVKSLINKEA